MTKRILIAALVWFLVVMIAVPLLVIFDVIGTDDGPDPLRTVLGIGLLLLAGVAVYLGVSGRPMPHATVAAPLPGGPLAQADGRSISRGYGRAAMLVLALLLAVLGLAIGGWLPISPEAVEHMPGTTTPRTFP